MANKGDLVIDSADTESRGGLSNSKQSVCISNLNYNHEEDIDNFEEVDLPPFTEETKDISPKASIVTSELHLTDKQFESQYKYQHQTYPTQSTHIPQHIKQISDKIYNSESYRPPSIPLSSRSPLPLFTMEENEDGTGVIEVRPEVCSIPSATAGTSCPQTPTAPSPDQGFFINYLSKGSQFIHQDPTTEPGQKRRASFGSGKMDSSNKLTKRRSSVVTIAPGFDAGTKEGENSSSSAFESKRLRYKRTSSFALTPQRSLRRYLTRDVLPHMDNYRHRMSFVKGMYQYYRRGPARIPRYSI